MRMLKSESPPGQIAVDDFIVPIERLVWMLLGIIAMWLNIDVSDAMGDNTFMNLAVSLVTIYLANLLQRFIVDNGKIEPEEK